MITALLLAAAIAAPPDGGCALPIANGTVLDAPALDDALNPSITVANGAPDDAWFKLVNLDTGSAIRAFVAKDREATIEVPAGRYQASYAVGGGLASDCRQVVAPQSVARFNGELQLVIEERTIEESGEMIVQRRVTQGRLILREAVSTKDSTTAITVADFNRNGL